MRPETKQRLDELEKREKRRKIWLMLGTLTACILLSGLAVLAYSPGKHLRDVVAVVEQSALGADQFGQRFHILKVRLADGRTPTVQTHVKSPLQAGKKITVELRETLYGTQYYSWTP